MKDEAPSRDDTIRIQSVVRWIAQEHGYVAAAIIRLGQVHFTPTIETAGVIVDGPRIHLLFNRNCFAKLRDAGLAAVLIHEAFHVAFKHQARAELIQAPWDRRYFDFATEAVINDLITLHFASFILPDSPIRGMTLVGCDTSKLSAEQVVELMKTKYGQRWQTGHGVLCSSTMDDHDLWGGTGLAGSAEQENTASDMSGIIGEGWTHQSDAQVDSAIANSGGRHPWGSSALGTYRSTPRKCVRKDLRHFLQEIVHPSMRYRTLWNQISRKSLAVYPDIILPVYDPENRLLNVLMAVDASASIPAHFLASAVHIAQQKIPGTKTTLVTFDTKVYAFCSGAMSVRGGGGTAAQAVENYARNEFKQYPDVVIVFSDGETPAPSPVHPDRWIWILPPWGDTRPISPQSRIAYFNEKATGYEHA